jgi:hypothetical protein
MKIVGSLEIIGIRDPNTQNERVLIKAINPTKLDGYLIINSKITLEGKLHILNDRAFWFPRDIEVKGGEYIRVYTVKKGNYKKSESKYGQEDAVFHDFFWGLDKPMWDMVTSNAVTVFEIRTWNTASKG